MGYNWQTQCCGESPQNTSISELKRGDSPEITKTFLSEPFFTKDHQYNDLQGQCQ